MGGTIRVRNIANMGVIFTVFGIANSSGNNTRIVGPPEMGAEV